MARVTINPVTRLEGHGRIEIFLNDGGDVANVYFQVPELRGFERFCVGRQAEEMPGITNRICGICPEAHHLAASKALDDLFQVDPPPAAKKLRELLYMAFFVTDHATHFYALGGPDLIVGPDAPPAERNLFGVIRKVGADVGLQVIDCRKRNHEVIRMLGGRPVHPAAGQPGGWSKPITEVERRTIEAVAQQNVDFALFSLTVFESVLSDAFLALITSDLYLHQTHYMGLVDDRNQLNLYDGSVRVVDPAGHEVVKYAPRDYAANIAERIEPWTYLKFPYLKQVGWKGFVDGPESGIYCASPLARLNVTDGLPTPRAHAEYQRLFETFGRKKIDGRYEPIHHRLATHWCRLIEMLYAAERMLELATDPEITSPVVRTIPNGAPMKAAGGVGCVEAPRGTLTHHYFADERSVLTKVNLIVGTTNNYAAMSMSLKRAAEQLIRRGQVIDEGLLNRIEMAFRLYDPCLSCATHALPGRMALRVDIRDPEGRVLQTLQRD
jgi:F420-non-reducing hydrogenase large subunit